LILESYDNHPPLVLPVSGCKLKLQALPEDPTFCGFYERIKEKGAWLTDCDEMIEKLDTSRRERPDGRELTKSEDLLTSLDHEVVASRMNELKIADVTDVSVSTRKETTQAVDKDILGSGKNISSSSECSTSSEPEAYVTNKNIEDTSKKSSGTNNQEDKDELVVLPVVETTSLTSHITSNLG